MKILTGIGWFVIHVGGYIFSAHDEIIQKWNTAETFVQRQVWIKIIHDVYKNCFTGVDLIKINIKFSILCLKKAKGIHALDKQ